MEKKLLFNNRTGLILLLLLLGNCLTTAAQVRLEDAAFLNKLNGTWRMSTRRSVIIETWQQKDDSTWLGQTWRVVKEKDSTLQQSIILARRGNAIYFMPTYEGRVGNPIQLTLRVLKPVGFVAEDLNNDFPKKVIYRFKDARHLDARVEGAQQGTIQEYIFNFEKQ
ncbi:hypothetical protein DVR12_03525 [Chitinophaga silvatica]|uniref:Lipocalin-like domain-containing protein n=1 Tax=Chitinophaga silvatica TaxID=2282649 RepID=A0A3E1YHP6_9BACT|nr:hypothetical protein [Chitinophaga silvatica]RFS26868.1 hypothetical protein DVR12_03525 [Chitinophaga silvatica]